ncbi:MAG: DUF6438 domain-containing protein [Cyclobacteriaceae bacterium]
MLIRLSIYSFLVAITISCNNTENLSKQKLLGEWELITENSARNKLTNFPFGIGFTPDSVEFFDGFVEEVMDSITGKDNYQYFGNFTPYKIQSDSIYIKNVLDDSWSYWSSFVKVEQDTLILTGKDSTELKYVRIHYNLSESPEFDQIIHSTTGCYGSCPMMDISVNQDVSLLFQGEGYTNVLGFFGGRLTKSQTEYIFNKFRKANISNLDNNYEVGHTDDTEITTTFIKEGRIIKTISDYGMAGPKELIWAYVPISGVYEQVALDSIPNDEPFYPKLHYYTFLKDSLILSLKKSESFYLWTELRDSQTVDTSFMATYELGFRRNYTYWGPDPNEKRQHERKLRKVDTDGRYFSFHFENDVTVTYDLGYDFVDKNFDRKDFRKPESWEL